MASSAYITPHLTAKLKVLGVLTTVLSILLVLAIVMAVYEIFFEGKG